MAAPTLNEVLPLLRPVMDAPVKSLWCSYDAEADVMYVNFKKPSLATDSELTDEDLIIRYEGDGVIGVTVLHASTR